MKINILTELIKFVFNSSLGLCVVQLFEDQTKLKPTNTNKIVLRIELIIT